MSTGNRIEENGMVLYGVKKNEEDEVVCEICGSNKMGERIKSDLINCKSHTWFQCACGNIVETVRNVDFIY